MIVMDVPRNSWKGGQKQMDSMNHDLTGKGLSGASTARQGCEEVTSPKHRPHIKMEKYGDEEAHT